MKTRWFWYLLLWLCCPAISIMAEETYVVGVGDYEYLPYHGIEDGEYTGYARELLDRFAQYAGCRLIYRPLAWKRLVLQYIDGELDLIFPDNPQWSTKTKEGSQVVYSRPVALYTDGVMMLPENLGKGVDHLKRLGTIGGFTVWDYYDEIASGQIELEESSDIVPLLHLVLLNRIDGAYIETSVADYYLREHLQKPDALVFDGDLPHTQDSYYLSSIHSPELIETFNEFLDAEHDAIDMLRQKYQIRVKAQP